MRRKLLDVVCVIHIEGRHPWRCGLDSIRKLSTISKRFQALPFSRDLHLQQRRDVINRGQTALMNWHFASGGHVSLAWILPCLTGAAAWVFAAESPLAIRWGGWKS